jgi:hypothetical protein
MIKTIPNGAKFVVRGALAAAAMLAVTCASPARAQEMGMDSLLEQASLDLGVDFYTRYMWRGMILTNDPVAQPSITAGIAGLSVNIWANYDLTDVNENGGDAFQLQELDYTVSYAFSPVEGLSLEAGWIYYTFPGTMFVETEELYASVGFEVPYLNPSVTVYWD